MPGVLPGDDLQIRHARAERRAAAAEGRPGGLAGRGRARDRLASSPGRPDHKWSDHAWLQRRRDAQSPRAPISVYEVHAASWLPAAELGASGLGRAGRPAAPYCAGLGFTHLELLPIMEHPFGGSWGYQPLGQFAPIVAPRPARGLRALRRPLPRDGRRRDPRLGAGALPDRRARPRPLRRHRRSTSTPTRARDSIATGTR